MDECGIYYILQNIYSLMLKNKLILLPIIITQFDLYLIICKVKYKM